MFGLALLIVMVSGALPFAGAGIVVMNSQAAAVAADYENILVLPSASSSLEIIHSAEDSTEKHIKDVLSGTPVLLAIAGCESGLKQFDGRGDVIRGRENKNDVGILQINGVLSCRKRKRSRFHLYPWTATWAMPNGCTGSMVQVLVVFKILLAKN